MRARLTSPSDDITTTQTYPTTTPPERALLVGLDSGGRNVRFSVHDSLDELAQLAVTAGAQVAAVYTQSREAPSPSHYLGKGKLREVTEGLEEHQANLVLFDDELSPTQQRNLENALKVKVLDRAAVILDIFAGRAHTREGRLQVELAQYQYLLPRLAGQWSHLERLGGGIGTRGPGETQIETDRRLIRNRIERLKDDLDDVRRHRSLYRRRRSVQGVPVVALVGYTNAGKSTLMNAIAGADVLAEDKLFATLDPTTRKIKLPSQREILLTDTVGFIQKLPTNLVAAFRATLEELTEASLLLHVFDISHQKAQEQVETVEQVLGELGVIDRPVLYVANKVDLATQYLPGGTTAAMTAIAEDITIPMEGDREAVVVSAEKGWGCASYWTRSPRSWARTWLRLPCASPTARPSCCTSSGATARSSLRNTRRRGPSSPDASRTTWNPASPPTPSPAATTAGPLPPEGAHPKTHRPKLPPPTPSLRAQRSNLGRRCGPSTAQPHRRRCSGCPPALASGESRGVQPPWQEVWRMCLHKQIYFSSPFLSGRGQGDGAHYYRGKAPNRGRHEAQPRCLPATVRPLYRAAPWAAAQWVSSALASGESRGVQPPWQEVWRMCLHEPISLLPPSCQEGGQGDSAHYYRGAAPNRGSAAVRPPHPRLPRRGLLAMTTYPPSLRAYPPSLRALTFRHCECSAAIWGGGAAPLPCSPLGRRRSGCPQRMQAGSPEGCNPLAGGMEDVPP